MVPSCSLPLAASTRGASSSPTRTVPSAPATTAGSAPALEPPAPTPRSERVRGRTSERGARSSVWCPTQRSPSNSPPPPFLLAATADAKTLNSLLAAVCFGSSVGMHTPAAHATSASVMAAVVTATRVPLPGVKSAVRTRGRSGGIVLPAAATAGPCVGALVGAISHAAASRAARAREPRPRLRRGDR